MSIADKLLSMETIKRHIYTCSHFRARVSPNNGRFKVIITHEGPKQIGGLHMLMMTSLACRFPQNAFLLHKVSGESLHMLILRGTRQWFKPTPLWYLGTLAY